MPTEFVNEPFSNFADPEVAAAFQAALDKVAGELGRDYPLIVGGEKIETDARIKSIDPSNPGTVVGLVSKADEAIVAKAMKTARKSFASWKFVPAEQRAQ